MVKNFIKSAKVGGGGDCEDMAGCNSALNYKWKNRSRFAMLIADRPCHEYNIMDYQDLIHFQMEIINIK